jgi:antitoxin component of RelBE/YafQ-DinJ toxin-antitoxin module
MTFKDIINQYKNFKKTTSFLSVLIDTSDKKLLERVSNDYNISLSELVRIIIKEFLKGESL